MGVSQLEARLLPAETGAEEVSPPLCYPAERGRGELHFPATGERVNPAELDSGDPAGFRFTIKAHQVITHIKRLQGTEDFVPRFLGTIEPLAAAEKLGPVLFQLPPNLKADLEVLRSFLQTLPKRLQAAFEFRHASWFSEETYGVLRASKAALCVAETEEMTTPEVATADFAYYRFRKPNYPPDERQAMVGRLERQLGAGRDVFAYFKHEETPEGAIYARDLLGSLPK